MLTKKIFYEETKRFMTSESFWAPWRQKSFTKNMTQTRKFESGSHAAPQAARRAVSRERAAAGGVPCMIDGLRSSPE